MFAFTFMSLLKLNVFPICRRNYFPAHICNLLTDANITFFLKGIIKGSWDGPRIQQPLNYKSKSQFCSIMSTVNQKWDARLASPVLHSLPTWKAGESSTHLPGLLPRGKPLQRRIITILSGLTIAGFLTHIMSFNPHAKPLWGN